MTVLITLTTAGSDSGPFNLYSNLDGYASAFAISVSKSALQAGYISTVVPDGTTIIRVLSTGACTNFIDITLNATTTTSTTPVPTTTTTTTVAPTTTTTTTIAPTTTTTTTIAPTTTTTTNTPGSTFWIGKFSDTGSAYEVCFGGSWSSANVYTIVSSGPFAPNTPLYTNTTLTTLWPINGVMSINNIVYTIVNGYTVGNGQPCSNITTTTTSTAAPTTTTTTSTTTAAPAQCFEYLLSTNTNAGANYTDCEGITQSVSIGGTSGYDSINFCALENTVVPNGDATLNVIGICTRETTTTSTTTTSTTTTSTTTAAPSYGSINIYNYNSSGVNAYLTSVQIDGVEILISPLPPGATASGIYSVPAGSSSTITVFSSHGADTPIRVITLGFSDCQVSSGYIDFTGVNLSTGPAISVALDVEGTGCF